VTVGQRHRVFVSYSRSDFYFAEQLAVALRRRGLDAWFDVHELSLGSDWSASIDRAIEESDVFVLVASRAALESAYVRHERELAARLGTSQVAVLAGRVTALELPTYDLRSSFARGVDKLVRDLAAGRPTGARPRLRLPIPGAAALVALAPAVAIVFAAALGVQFFHDVSGHSTDLRPKAGTAYLVAVASLALAAGLPAYTLWSFLRRRIAWRWLLGGFLTMPLVALLSIPTVGQAASYLSSDPILIALGVTEDQVPGAAPALLLVLLAVVCIAAAIATEFSAGACRYLRTGIAPRRVRTRHTGVVPRPIDDQNVAHSFRLIAADDDARVGDEVRQSLAAAGLREVAGDFDRDVVVLSDRTPTSWLSRGDLRHPIAVAATSFSLPVRGVLERFQWVDYRARRKATLQALARDLTATPGSTHSRAGGAPDIPERLQLPRVPVGVAVAEWTLFSAGLLAATVSAYVAALWAFTDRPADLWPSLACVAVTPAFVVLGRLVRRRRITPLRLVGASILGWAAMIALGLDGTLQAMYPSYDAGLLSIGTVVYAVLFAAVLAITWRSLGRWLPDRRWVEPAAPTLGYARSSWAFLVVVVPALLSAASSAAFNSPKPAAASSPTVTDVCRDHDDIEALGKPYSAATAAIRNASTSAFRPALERRIPIIDQVTRKLDRLDMRTSRGADIRARLVDALDAEARTDQAFLRGEISGPRWASAGGDLRGVIDELSAMGC
jgi:hypothetical protein